MSDEKFHIFNRTVAKSELPPRFTYPFCYTPHPLCVEATELVKQYLSEQTHLLTELNNGKMLGVMIVENIHGEIGFLAAFSGNLAHSNNLPYFVPAVYDLLDPNGEFCRGEKEISLINRQITLLQSSKHLADANQEFKQESTLLIASLEKFRTEVRAEKAQRDAIRATGGITAEQEAELIARSQYLKAELKRRKKATDEAIANLPSAQIITSYNSNITALKQKRQSMSSHLQQRLFRLFVMRNASGESRDLSQIFQSTTMGVPPAGAGECAAPKLMQYALLHNLKPRAMAEFWWGKSPSAEIRHHGNFYPACRSKCLPILTYMMKGLAVDPNPHDTDSGLQIQVVYDDSWLTIVNKPSGLATVPGKINATSLLQQYSELFPDAEGPMIVHRLDMHTSGLVIVAKNKTAHQRLQSLFASRQIDKRYEALLCGTIHEDTGVISLPLCPDINDRPRQLVDFKNGKDAVTEYRVITRQNGITRIEFHPLTGRTHQLRVHTAHSLGLNAPILGDNLYSKQTYTEHHSQRLCLHAKSLRFIHPFTSQPLFVTIPTPF